LAAKQVADQCHKWVPSKPKFEVEETTRINRAACKKLTLAQGSVNLSSGDKFLKTPSGITVLPALPGVRSINMVPAYP
jgi:hypothetical protein